MPDAVRTQDDRFLAIATSLGDDKLLLRAMHGTESLGRLFEYELDLMAEGTAVDYTKILGQNVTIRLDMQKEQTRFFNGYISKFTFIALDEPNKEKKKIFHYRATMVPRMWFLTRRADCRIFQNKTVPQIIKEVLKLASVTDVKDDKLSGTYRTWEYCVQYRETDFNFISRLMENEGIYYYFEHENGKHTLILCDGPSAHKAAEKYDELHFDEPDLSSEHDAYIWNWVMGREITPNQYSLKDYDPLQPQSMLEKVINIEHTHDPDTYEIYDYPGGYVKPEESKGYTTMRLEELEAQYAVAHGTSSARGIYAGAIFKLVEHPAFDEDEYLITSVSYQLENDDMGIGMAGAESDGEEYLCQITCIPKTYEFRTPRTTAKPVVQGPQTAKVVGPSGEEIHTDKYGRVKVKFYWDRDDKVNETSSCFVRVSQPWAGKGWGAISIPRMGQEVIVEFLEGDPDRPIITGRVYNGDNMPPYALPANQTMTVMKTNTSKGGGNFNEIRFEDKKDSEQLYMFAGKNMDLRVKNDRFETVEHDMHVTVNNDAYLNVKGKYHVKIAADYYEEGDADHHETIGGNENQDIGGNRSLNIGGKLAEAVGGDHANDVGGQYFLKANDIIIQGMASITLKVGGSSIAIGSDGIQLKTDGDIKILSSGATKISADSQFSASAPSCKISGEAEVKISGGQITASADGKLGLTAGGILQAQGSMVKIN